MRTLHCFHRVTPVGVLQHLKTNILEGNQANTSQEPFPTAGLATPALLTFAAGPLYGVETAVCERG